MQRSLLFDASLSISWGVQLLSAIPVSEMPTVIKNL